MIFGLLLEGVGKLVVLFAKKGSQKITTNKLFSFEKELETLVVSKLRIKSYWVFEGSHLEIIF